MAQNPKDIREVIPALDEIINKADVMANKFKEVNEIYEKFGRNIIESSKKITAESKKLTGATEDERDQIEENAKAAERLRKAQEAYTQAMSENEQQIRNIRQTQREFLKQRQLEEKIANSAEGSYDQLSAKYALLKRQLNALSKEERQNTQQGREMVEQARVIREEMNALQTETGNYSLQVGNYTQINEVLQGQLEGLMDGFDDVTEGMGGAAQGALQLGKQFLKLMANPIVAALAVVAGAAIALGKAFMSTRAGSNGIRKSMTEISAGLDVAKKRLSDYIDNVKKSAKEQGVGKTILKEWLKALIPVSYALDNQGNSYEGLRKKIAAMKKELIDLNSRYIDIENESLIRIANLQAEAQQLSILADDDTTSMAQMIKNRNRLMKVEIERAREEESLAQKKMEIAELEMAKGIELGLVRRTEAGELISLKNEGIKLEKMYSEAKIEVIAASNEVLTVEKENAQKRRMVELDVFEQRLDLLLDVADREKAINEQRLADDRILLSDKAQILEETKKLVEESFQDQLNLFDADLGVQLDRNELMDLNNQEIVEYAEGLEMANRATNRLREVIIERRQAVEDLIVAERDLTQKTYEYELKSFSDTQELEMLRLKNSKATAEEISDFEITQKIAMYEKELELAETYGQNLTQTEIDIIRERIKSLRGELEKEVVAKEETIWDKMGLSGEGLKKVKDNLKIAVNEVKKIFQQFADERIAQADLVLEQSERETEAAENDLNRQIELQQQGYASNVEGAQRNLDLAKETEKKAIEEKKKAQRLKEQIDTAEQISSIIAASANILKGWSAIPIVGQVLGIAAIGTMIASFIATKAKVRAQAKEQFAQGDYIDLEGGSHASGNDIAFGQRNGKIMTAEGGESAAIFNKRARGKYGKLLPGLVADINKGRLEERYNNAFEINLPEKDFDYAGFDSDELKLIRVILGRIERQGNSNIMFDKNGRKIVKKGNITTRIS